MINVLLADDFEIARVLMCYVLKKAGSIEALIVVSNRQEAVHETTSHCPNVVVLDISMSIMDGVEAAKQISEKFPETQMLMVSMHHTHHHLRRSIEAGHWDMSQKMTWT